MRNTDKTRALILSKAMPIFNTKGYQATSLSDITKASGITKGAIYGNFRNKDEVASASFDLAATVITDQIRASVRAEPTAPLKLKAIVNYYTNYVTSPPIEGGCPILNTAVEADDNYPVLRAQVLRTLHQIKEALIKIIYRGIREKQLEDTIDVESTATFLYAAIQGGIVVSRLEGDDISYRAVKDQLFTYIERIST